MHYADSVGAAQIVEKLDELAKEDALVWRASPVLRDCAARGINLKEYGLKE